MEFTFDQNLWLALAALCVGLSKGGLPGIGMLAVPMLALFMSPIAAAALLLPIYLLSDAVAVYLYRHEYSLKYIKLLIPAGLLGVLVGAVTASWLPDQAIALLIGLMGVIFCVTVWVKGDSVGKLAFQSDRAGYFWGSLSGFTSFVAHAGAPPYQIYLLPKKLPRMVFAGTTTFVFAAVNLAKIVPYSLIQPFTSSALKVSLVFLPIALVGTVVGKFAIQRLSDKWFYRLVQIALFVICLRLIWQSLQHWVGG